MKGCLSRLLLLSVSSIVGLGLCELILRLLPPGAEFRDTRVETYRTAPLGHPDFRGREVQLDKPADVFRLLVVGDSYTWGPGVYPQDAFPARLERRLGELVAERRLEVVPWSRSGWNTEIELMRVKDHLPRLQPDVLIIGFVLNDPEPSDRGLYQQMQRQLHRRTPQGKLGQLLQRHSRLFGVVNGRLENTRQRRAFHDYYHQLFADGPSWLACIAALREFRNLATEHSSELLLVVFPVFDSQLGDEYAYRNLHATMIRLGHSLEIPVLDLLPAYQGIDARRLALEPFTDPHPSELGHRIAADAILEYLLDHSLLPVLPP